MRAIDDSNNVGEPSNIARAVLLLAALPVPTGPAGTTSDDIHTTPQSPPDTHTTPSHVKTTYPAASDDGNKNSVLNTTTVIVIIVCLAAIVICAIVSITICVLSKRKSRHPQTGM